MAKRIVICIDGTWDTPESRFAGHTRRTNVIKMVRAITPCDQQGVEQVIYYVRGIGTGTIGFLDRHIGGATGAGISRTIQDCYRFIANNHNDGDELFLFGFSRGAYSVRSLSGLLNTVGLISKNELRYVPHAYAYYHTPTEKRRSSPHYDLIHQLNRRIPPAIKFLGVWDTVGALGVPMPGLRRIQNWIGKRWKSVRVGFHNCRLVSEVENAFQGLALDERRGPFRPALWDASTGQKRIQQVWFPGVHRNVGGGCKNEGLSDIAFRWLASRAVECGLEVSEGYIGDKSRVNPDPLGPIEDSYTRPYKTLGKLGIGRYIRPVGEHLAIGEMLHESVIKRMKSTEGGLYRPSNITNNNDVPAMFKKTGRDYVWVNGHDVPILYERIGVRCPANDAGAQLRVANNGDWTHCQVVDLAADRGARLRLSRRVRAGDTLQLNSDITGQKECRVVWAGKEEAGVAFT